METLEKRPKIFTSLRGAHIFLRPSDCTAKSRKGSASLELAVDRISKISRGAPKSPKIP